MRDGNVVRQLCQLGFAVNTRNARYSIALQTYNTRYRAQSKVTLHDWLLGEEVNHWSPTSAQEAKQTSTPRCKTSS